jgi:hypothetical protein
MSLGAENRKLSLAECKKILNTDGLCYTDEEVLKIRDYLYHLADLTIDALDKNAVLTEKEINYLQTRNKGNP